MNCYQCKKPISHGLFCEDQDGNVTFFCNEECKQPYDWEVFLKKLHQPLSKEEIKEIEIAFEEFYGYSIDEYYDWLQSEDNL